MSFKDAFGKAKGKSKKKPAIPIDAVKGDGQELVDHYTDRDFPAKKPGKKGGFAEAAKNAKKKKSKK